MFLAYMDESGNTGTKVDLNQPIHMLGCMLVEDVNVRVFEDAISAVAIKHFPALALKNNFEFHGGELFHGKGHFKGLPLATRIEAMKDLVAVAVQHATAYGYTGVDKTKSFANDHPHRIAFTLMVESLEPWLRARDALGLIVADEQNEIGQNLITDMEWFKQHSTSWGYVHVNVNQIIDSVHFVKSHNSRLIQVCDVITYMRLKSTLLHKANFDQWLAITGERPDYQSWLAESLKPIENQTREIGLQINQITSFRAKIWPN